VEKAYSLVKFISLGLIVLTGLMIAGRETLQTLNGAIGNLPTVTIFAAHIISVLTLISSVVFITVFNLFTRRPVIFLGNLTPSSILMRWVIPTLTLITGLAGLVIYEPFRWVVPFWLLNLGWDVIFAAKEIHLWLAYAVTLLLATYLVIRFTTHRRMNRQHP
jgi:thiosulfate reductase cytochrome b subunit